MIPPNYIDEVIMLISIINHTNGKLSDEEVQRAIQAINRQIKEDFNPHWHRSALLQLVDKIGEEPDEQSRYNPKENAFIYLWDKMDEDDALGYHDRNNRGIPYGFVFTELSKELNESWTVTLSHEVLELICDPEVNLLVSGHHPVKPSKKVFHWYEVCDAVQTETYKIDDVEVSNFLLPLYFTENEEIGSQNDFLGTMHNGKTIKSFGVNPGGYIGFYDPDLKEHTTYSLPGDQVSKKRLLIKIRAKQTRRANRYKNCS